MSSENRDTRVRILEATLTLLEAGTPGAARMADIARAAGVSRQAVYLHFESRAELLIAATRHLDRLKDVDGRLEASRTAQTGEVRLAAYIEAWGNYIPEVYGVARALMDMERHDAEASAALEDRARAVRDGCEAAIKALKRDGALATGFSVAKATDLLAMLLSIRNWETLVVEDGWTQKQYIDGMRTIASATFVRGAE